MSPTWDILIPSIAHRTDLLTELLAHLEPQLLPGVGVLVYRDNREEVYGPKCQKLYEASRADYVSMLDDDDWVEDDYVPTVMKALKRQPDYVGYKVLYTEFGQPRPPIVHSLTCGGWFERDGKLYRDICQKNPLRRELALKARWEADGGADLLWAWDLRQLAVVKNEIFIGRELYHYRSTGGYSTSSLPPLENPPPRPDVPWVTWVE